MKAHLLSLALLLTGLSLGAVASERGIMPAAGISIPIGTTGKEWNNGLAMGIRIPLNDTRHGEWAVEATYKQMSPNAEERLKTGGRDLKVDRSEGVSRVVGLGVIGSRGLLTLRDGRMKLDGEYGAGVFLVADGDIHLKGSYLTSSSALTREIFQSGDSVIVPGVSFGLGLRLGRGASVGIHLQNLFTAESSRQFFSISLGFHSR